jgi:hypothetical protein
VSTLQQTPYQARIQRERLRIERTVGLGEPHATRSEIENLTRWLHEDGRPDPITRLSGRLGADRRAVDFLTFVIAACSDPVCGMALNRLYPGSSQRGVSVATYAAIAGISDEARELAIALATNHPLVESCVLESRSEDDVTPALRLWAVTPRIPQFLENEKSLPCRPVIQVETPEIVLFDVDQRAVLDELVRFCDAARSLTLVIEGPSGSGRSTAVAMACRSVGRSVAQLPLSEVIRSPAALEQGLRALRRETSLTGAMPLIANVDELDGVGCGSFASLSTRGVSIT